MKHIVLSLFLAAATLTAHAQVEKQASDNNGAMLISTKAPYFGYFSYDKVLTSMPEYATALQTVQELRAKYDNEMKRVESEFNKKYEEFLEGQRDFAPSILHKRQAELQQLMEKNMAFKQEALRLLQKAEAQTFAPLKTKLTEALNRLAYNYKLDFVLNTDNNAVPFVNITTGRDLTPVLIQELH